MLWRMFITTLIILSLYYMEIIDKVMLAILLIIGNALAIVEWLSESE